MDALARGGEEGGGEAEGARGRMLAAKAKLIAGAAEGDHAAVEEALGMGASPLSRSGEGIGALHWACGASDIARMAKKAKFYGAMGHVPAEDSPGRWRTVEALIKAGAPVSGPDGGGMHPAHWAARAGLPGVLGVLAAAGADMSAPGRGGATPLMEACSGKDAYAPGGAVDRLLSLGVDVAARDGQGREALARAVRDPGAVAALLRAGADPGARSKSGREALHAACDANRLASAMLLMEAGADPGAVDASGTRPWELGGGKAAARVAVEAEARAISGAAGPARQGSSEARRRI